MLMKKLFIFLLVLWISVLTFGVTAFASEGVAPVEAETQTSQSTQIPDNAVVIDGDKIYTVQTDVTTPNPTTGITMDWLPLILALVALVLVAVIPMIVKAVKGNKTNRRKKK